MNRSGGLPRVLVLCDEPINRIGGGGVTMGNLFRGWPHDGLAQVWAHHRFEIDAEVCPNYLRLGDHSIGGDESAVLGWIKQQRTMVKRLRGFIRPGVRLDYDHVLSWARGFAPEVLYSQATPYPMYTWWLPRWLSRDLNVPLVNHIMDDWPAALRREWLPLQRQLMTPILRRQLKELFELASVNLVISAQMADAYSERYGMAFVPFHNTIDMGEWREPKRDYSMQGEYFDVVYLGALSVDVQVRSLRDVALAISSLAERGIKIRLTVYTGEIFREYYEQFLGGLPAVSHGGRVARQDLCARLSAADLLVVPVNFDEQSLAFIGYSMPTKVPEYMASGAPVLVYAPDRVPPAAYAQQDGWGHVVGERDPRRLEQALVTLMESEELRARLGRRGRELAVRNHDARIVRKEFQEVLRSAAASTRAGA